MSEHDQTPHSAKRAVEFCISGNWTGLISYAQNWRDSDKTDYLPHYYLGIALNNMGMQSAAIESYERAISINATDPKVWDNLACVVGSARGFGEAEKYHKTAIQVGPINANAHYNYGTMLGQHGRSREAVEMLAFARSLDPSRPETLSSLIKAYDDEGHYIAIRDLLPSCQELLPAHVPELKRYLKSKGI